MYRALNYLSDQHRSGRVLITLLVACIALPLNVAAAGFLLVLALWTGGIGYAALVLAMSFVTGMVAAAVIARHKFHPQLFMAVHALCMVGLALLFCAGAGAGLENWLLWCLGAGFVGLNAICTGLGIRFGRRRTPLASNKLHRA